METINRFLGQLFTIGEWAKRIDTGRFCFHIPGTKGIQSQFFLFKFIQLIHQRHYMQFYCFMKLVTIFFAVIKAAQFGKTKIPVITKTGIQCHLMTLFQEIAEQRIQFFLIL